MEKNMKNDVETTIQGSWFEFGGCPAFGATAY